MKDAKQVTYVFICVFKITADTRSHILTPAWLHTDWKRHSDQSIPHQQMPARLNGCNDLSNHYTALLIVSSRYLCHQYHCRYSSIPRWGALSCKCTWSNPSAAQRFYHLACFWLLVGNKSAEINNFLLLLNICQKENKRNLIFSYNLLCKLSVSDQFS